MTSMGMVTAPQICGRQEPAAINCVARPDVKACGATPATLQCLPQSFAPHRESAASPLIGGPVHVHAASPRRSDDLRVLAAELIPALDHSACGLTAIAPR
jgi:hypothetical protein